MKELTKEQRQRFDELWELYLDEQEKALDNPTRKTFDTAMQAHDAYRAYMKAEGIVGTLAGFKVDCSCTKV